MSETPDEFIQWHRKRIEQVTGPTGNAALIAYIPVSSSPVDAGLFPATIRYVGDTTVEVTAHKDGIAIKDHDGITPIPAGQSARLGMLRNDGLPLLTYGSLHVDSFSLDEKRFELRVYDARSPHLKAFKTIDVYDYDPNLVVQGTIEFTDVVRNVPWGFTRPSDNGRIKHVPGTLTITVHGETRMTTLFLNGNVAVLVFADGTTGIESHAPGRFLALPPADNQGNVTVDFNYAFVPPCGFSAYYSCPVPPSENKFITPIRAGEKKAVFND